MVSFIPTAFAKEADKGDHVLYHVSLPFVYMADCTRGSQNIDWRAAYGATCLKKHHSEGQVRPIIYSFMGIWFGKQNMRWVIVGTDMKGCIEKGIINRTEAKSRAKDEEAKLWRSETTIRWKLGEGEKIEKRNPVFCGRSSRKCEEAETGRGWAMLRWSIWEESHSSCSPVSSGTVQFLVQSGPCSLIGDPGSILTLTINSH